MFFIVLLLLVVDDDNNDNACKFNVNAKLYITIMRNFEKNSDEYNDNSSLSSMSSSSVIIPVDLLFTLALINNLGLIYYTVNERDRSRTCFKNMFSTMMYLMDSNESQSIKEWDGLLSNAMDILKIGNEVAAPAA